MSDVFNTIAKIHRAHADFAAEAKICRVVRDTFSLSYGTAMAQGLFSRVGPS